MVQVGDLVELPDGRIGEVLHLEGSPLYATVAVEGAGDRVDTVGCAVDELVTGPTPPAPEPTEPEPLAPVSPPPSAGLDT